MSLRKWIEVESLEEFSRLDAPAQRLDARAKAVVTLAFIVCVMSFPRYEIAALMPFAAYPLAMVSWSRMPASYLLRKILPVAPFALAVAIFNPLIDRTPLVEIGLLTLSGGWVSLASVLIRFALTVSAALALAACTGMHRLCGGLERLGMPRVFAVQLLFLHRYLFVVADEGGRMARGMEMRGARPGKLPLPLAGSLLGHLLLRAMARADRIYRAMAARGFDGEIRTMDRTAWGARDGFFTAGWIVYFGISRLWNVSERLGNLLAGSVQ